MGLDSFHPTKMHTKSILFASCFCGLATARPGWNSDSFSQIGRPDYTVLEQHDGYQLRRYEPSVWTTAIGNKRSWGWNSNSAFQQLFKYISGANEYGIKIDMTAPVLSVSDSYKERQWFYLPEIHHADPPVPTAQGVENVKWDSFDVYVLYYNPSDRSERMDKPMTDRLVSMLKRDGVQVKAGFTPVTAGYSGPWARTIEREIWITMDQIQKI